MSLLSESKLQNSISTRLHQENVKSNSKGKTSVLGDIFRVPHSHVLLPNQELWFPVWKTVQNTHCATWVSRNVKLTSTAAQCLSHMVTICMRHFKNSSTYTNMKLVTTSLNGKNSYNNKTEIPNPRTEHFNYI